MKINGSVNCDRTFTVKMGENFLQEIDRFEVEESFSKLLDYGDISVIAEKIGKSATVVSQYFNPNNERVNPIYRALCIVVAILQRDQQKGRQALKLFTHFAGRYIEGWLNDSSADIRKSLVSKWETFITGEIEQRSTELQVKALEGVVLDAQRLLTAKRNDLRRANAKQVTLQKFGPLRAVGK